MNHQGPSRTPESSQGLLDAVLKNPRVRHRLDTMPADERTLELASESGAELAHPDWKAGQSTGTAVETIELPAHKVSGTNHPVDKGFVPRRRVATLRDGKHEDTDYRIVGRLGSGGTGVVYQAHQRAIDREVALKVLREELAVSELSRERFLTEARVIGGLDHPNVIALHEVCVDDFGGLFYSMKRIDGTSWDQQIGEMSLDENISTLLDVADAIRYAHSRALIHRDIKPENVMLGKFGEVLVADWGLAISHGNQESTHGIHHTIGGTPAYMAPELATGSHGEIGYHTDVYLLGAVLFQILTGFPPHRGKSLLACIHAAARNEIVQTDVEGELMDIARKAMATKPADRFQSVDRFIEAIRDQRKHDESSRMVHRACQRLAQATDAHQYEDYRVADALLMEALEVWPENQRAHETRHQLRMQFAQAATDRGDLDLALSIYETAGQADSDPARHVRGLRDRREEGHRRVSRYSALFTQSPEAGLLIELNTSVVVEANEMFGTLFGYAHDQIVGRRIAELNLWACPERRNEMVEELKRIGSIDNFEAPFLHTDGHVIHVLISGRIVDLQGQQMVVSSIRDISLRKQAENDLKKSRQRLHDVQRLAGLATWACDIRTGEVTWSEEAFLLAGRSVDQGVPSKEEFYEMIHPDDRDKLKESFEAALQSGAAYELVVRQQAAGGQYRQLLMRGQPIFDDDGNTIEVYGVLIPQKA